MAIFHLTTKPISRSNGRSAVAAAAYRSGERLTDERTGTVHDYRRRQGVQHSEIMCPADAVKWAQDRAALWNWAESQERRKDARVAREIEVALPHELSQVECIMLVRRFVQVQFVDRGLAADIAWHSPALIGDERNNHCHVLVTTRAVAGGCMGEKARWLDRKESLEAWRPDWAAAVNDSLRRAGRAERVDSRSLVRQRAEKMAQGDLIAADALDREPGVKLGQAVTAAFRLGHRSPGDRWQQNEQVRAANRTRVRLKKLVRRLAIDLSNSTKGLLAGLTGLRDVSIARSLIGIEGPSPRPPRQRER